MCTTMPSSPSLSCKPEVSLTRSSKSFFFYPGYIFLRRRENLFYSLFYVSHQLIEKHKYLSIYIYIDTPDAHMQVRSTHATSLLLVLVITNCINNIFSSLILALSLSIFSLLVVVSLRIIALHFSITKNCSLQVCHSFLFSICLSFFLTTDQKHY
jgi:hypothetical protein